MSPSILNEKSSFNEAYINIDFLERVEQRLFPGDSTSTLSQEYVGYYISGWEYSKATIIRNSIIDQATKEVSFIF